MQGATATRPRLVEVVAALSLAADLGLTADHHIQHIYAKIGASNRSVATIFAMRHGLV